MFLAILSLVAQITAPSPAQITAPPLPPPLATPSASVSSSPAPSLAPSPAAAFTVMPARLELSPAQQQTLTVSGASLPLVVILDRRLVSFTVDQTAATITVTATQATGTDVLHVTDARGAVVDVPVRVAFRAGTVVPATTLKITGSSVDPQWLARMVTATVARLTAVLPGAQTTISAVAPPPSGPQPGTQIQFDVPVQIAGGSAYYDVAATTTVTVQNVPTDPFDPLVLFYDDDPERVTSDGVLYRGTIDSTHSARLYYYHDGGEQPHRVLVLLSTQLQKPASVQVIDSTAGPNLDVMSVGHAASKNFLLNKSRNQGVIVDLDPTAPRILDDVSLQYREGVAGVVGLRVLSGSPVTVTVIAASPGVDPLLLASGDPLTGDGHHRTGAFSAADYGNASLTYTVGGSDATLVYGDREPTSRNLDSSAPGHDYGDYGILWNIAFTLANPTPEPATVYLYERPIGGIVRSSFLVDGNLVDMGCVKRSIPYQIGAYALAPNQTYRLSVQTMTDGGSNYPLELGITATPPQPTPPPISSADGCFPK